MSRRLIYMAHPLAPSSEELDGAKDQRCDFPSRDTAMLVALRANINRALRWLAWLREHFPEVTFIAPWIAMVQSLDGSVGAAEREAGLRDDCTVVERCDGIVLCGGRISIGMRREMEHGVKADQGICEALSVGHGPVASHFTVYDLTPLGSEPTACPPRRSHMADLDRWVADGCQLESTP